MIDPTATLRAGLMDLDPVLARFGFVLTGTSTRLDLSGSAALATYARGDRRVELVVRATLDTVTYRLDDLAVGHAAYLGHLGMVGAFPGPATPAGARFAQLATDLPITLTHFTSPTGERDLERFIAP